MDQFIKHFRREGSGDWVCVQAATLELPQGRVQVTPGSRFKIGTRFMNVDLADMLDNEYRRQQFAIIGRLFTRAAERSGSAQRLAKEFNIPDDELAAYMAGGAMPSDDLLVKAVEIIMEELPSISLEFSQAAREALADRLISARRGSAGPQARAACERAEGLRDAG